MATLALAEFTGAAGQTLQTYTADSGATFSKHVRSGSANLVLDGTGGLRNSGSGVPVAYLCDEAPGTADQTHSVTYKRLSTNTFQGAYLLFRASDTLLTGYAVGLNVSTARVEFYRLEDDGSTVPILRTLLTTIPVVLPAVGASKTLEVRVWDPDGIRVRLSATWGGSALTLVDDMDATRIVAVGHVGLYQKSSGGNNTDGIHIDTLTLSDAGVGVAPTAPTGVAAILLGATSATLESVDASTDETGWHDYYALDAGGVPDASNVVDLESFASTTTAATGGTVSRTVSGLPPGTVGVWLGRAAIGPGGESAITWASEAIDTPAIPVVNSIESPIVGTTIPAGTQVVLSATLTDSESSTWWRGDPNDGGEQLGPNPYTYDTVGRLNGVETLCIQGLNSYGDEALSFVNLGIGETATGLALGSDFMIISQNEPDAESRTVYFDARNADGSPYEMAIEDGVSVVLGSTPATNAPVAVNATRGKYKVELTLAEVATKGAFDVGFEDYDGMRFVQIQSGPAVNDDGEVIVSLLRALDTQAKADVKAQAAQALVDADVPAISDLPPDVTGDVAAVQTAVEALPAASDSASAFLDFADAIDGLTPRQTLGVMFAILRGIVSGMENNAPVFRDGTNTVNRVTAVTDEHGNRTSVNLDLTGL